MKLYYAPMEGITTNIYRNTHNSFVGYCDEYWAPFIAPSENERITAKTLKDVLPKNNKNVNLKVQVLTNIANAFNSFAPKVEELGYDEINLNLGCPAGTVVGKGRGSGFLKYPNELDAFLDNIYSSNSIKISLKTRIGFESPDEMYNLLEIYNKYPASELVVHPRTRQEFYKGVPHMDIFDYVYDKSALPVCYNGNIFEASDYESVMKKYPSVTGVMIGRGAVANPGIFREIRTGQKTTKEDLTAFTELLAQNYNKVLNSDTYTLHKLKEIWIYMILNFDDCKKQFKTMKKTDSLSEFIGAVNALPEVK